MKKITNNQSSPVDMAFKKIKEMMYHHEIVPGQKLLYQELADKFNMSATPIIQALNRLQFLNIVVCERNRGYSVGESNVEEVKELFNAREAFEVYLVPKVIKELTAEKLKSINKAMNEHVKGISIPQHRRLLMIKDATFHLTIIESSGNRVIHNICKNIFEQIYLKYRPEFMIEERIKQSAEEHVDILKAIEDGEIAKSKRLFRNHIGLGCKHIVESLWEDKKIESQSVM